MDEQQTKGTGGSRILEGVRVVDWSGWHVGPEGAALLGDMGADVIHIEEKGVGDAMRGVHRVYGIDMDLPGGRHALFEHHNRNKRGMALDLRKPQGREVVYRLVAQADVFLTNYRRRATERLGLDYPSLAKINPRLIYASSTGFGEEGPDREHPGLAFVAQARSGIVMASGDASSSAPTFVSSAIGDEITGIMLAFGVIAALLARERTGVGQEVTTSQLTSLMKLQAQSITTRLLTGREIPRQDRSQVNNPMLNYYRAKDGRWISLALIRHPEWPRFCQAVGLEELIDDPRFKEATDREKNRAELVRILDDLFAQRTASEWLEVLHRADLISSPVNTISDLLTDSQVLANDYIIDYQHPALGPIKFLGFPFQFSRTPVGLFRPAPSYGEHTEEVLLGAGYTWDDIAGFKEEGVID